jgi:outer membrane protein assembly factor BamE (lipoprotein component of BamABCDE complex)
MKRLIVAMMIAAAMGLVVSGCSKGDSNGEKAGNDGDRSGGASATAGSGSEAKSSGGAMATVGKVKMGMTRDEVVTILGEPTTQAGFNADGMNIVHCTWETDDGVVNVQFHDGKAAVVHEGREGAAGDVDAGKVKANFSKVQPGMSESDVDALLGPATSSGGVAEGGAMSMVVKTWEVDGATYTISFMNGKVYITAKE